MKIYLTGAYEGLNKTFKGVQFIDGVAEVRELSNILRRIYKVSEEMPIGLVKKEEVVKPNEDEVAAKAEKVLSDLVAEKKGELNAEKLNTSRSLLDQFNSFTNWGEMRAFVKEKTGINVNSKKKAIEILTSMATN